MNEIFTPKKIGIIGSKGQMGKWFTEQFKQDGYDVLESDINSDDQQREQSLSVAKRNYELMREVDGGAVLFSIPIQSFRNNLSQVVQGNTQVLNQNLFFDVSSLKKDPVDAMLNTFSSGSVIGTHPMFKADIPNVAGQNVVLCPTPQTNPQHFAWLEDWWKMRKVQLISTSSEGHDKAVSFTQFGSHLMLLLRNFLERKEHISSQIYSYEIAEISESITCRFLSNTPSVLAGIAIENPNNLQLVELIISLLEKIQNSNFLLETSENVALDQDVLSLREYIRSKIGVQDVQYFGTPISKSLDVLTQMEGGKTKLVLENQDAVRDLLEFLYAIKNILKTQDSVAYFKLLEESKSFYTPEQMQSANDRFINFMKRL